MKTPGERQMGYYFDDRESAAWILGSQPEGIIRLMAAKYMGDHPELPFVWRAWDRTGIGCSRKGGYEFDFGRRFPEGSNGETACALGDLYCLNLRSLFSWFPAWARWFSG